MTAYYTTRLDVALQRLREASAAGDLPGELAAVHELERVVRASGYLAAGPAFFRGCAIRARAVARKLAEARWGRVEVLAHAPEAAP